ncbi:MAG: hypothetical protein U9O85_10745 [Euryarchaeota archaeon]|nr:hypothetical protein [Euryarchaeota archaeon]
MQQGAADSIREITKDFLVEIERKLGKEYEIVKELSAHDPLVEKHIAFLLNVREKFKNSDELKKALLSVLELSKTQKVDDELLDQLRDSGLVSIVIEDPEKPPELIVNSHIEYLFNQIKESMQIEEFIEWFCRSDVETIPITKARWYVLDDFARLKEALPDADLKKDQIEKILADYELFRESFFEEEEHQVCAEMAINIAKTAVGLIEPGMSLRNDFEIVDYFKMLKSISIPDVVRSDFHILYGYYCRPPDAISSYRDLYVIQEKLNNLLENIQKICEEIFVERIILFSDSDFVTLGNFLNKRLSEFNLLMISPSEEEMDQHILICWRSKKTGIYGTNIEIKGHNYFDAVIKQYYDARYPFIPYPIQDLLRFHGLSEDLISKGSQKRFAQHYELAILLNHLTIHYPQLKLIFASQDKAIFGRLKVM